MVKKIKEHSFEIGIVTLVLLVTWALTTGRTAGNWESKVIANESDIEKNAFTIESIEKKIEPIPVLESQYTILKEDIGELKDGQLSISQDIKSLLKRK